MIQRTQVAGSKGLIPLVGDTFLIPYELHGCRGLRVFLPPSSGPRCLRLGAIDFAHWFFPLRGGCGAVGGMLGAFKRDTLIEPGQRRRGSTYRRGYSLV